MRLLRLLALSALVAACHGKSNAAVDANADGGSDTTAFIPACAPAPTAPSSASRPDLREKRLTSLTVRASSMVDVAPGRTPDAEHPAGTVFVATVLQNERHRGDATLFEWDVASARPLNPEGLLFDHESDKEDLGKIVGVRLAMTRDTAFVVLTREKGRRMIVGKSPLRAHGAVFGESLPSATNISIETDGRWVAIAYDRRKQWVHNSETPDRGVVLYDAHTMKRVASAPFWQSDEVGERYDILEMVDGRLFAASASEAELEVVELGLPTLKVLRKVDVKLPKGRTRVQLTRVRGHLAALSHDTLVELSPELEVIGKRDLHSDEVAIGPGGELLTPLGLEVPGRRGDFVPDVRASASCTPWWAGAYPLLACSVDMDGVRIARLAPR